MATVSVTDETFADVVSGPGVVLVYFHAKWCGPCKAYSPLINEIAADYAGRVTIAKIDVDESPRLAASHFVRSIPTLILFRDGEIVGIRPGRQKREIIESWIRGVL